MSFLTFDEIVNDLVEDVDLESKASMKVINMSDLILYHHSYGTMIRNEYIIS